jgi:hypothetical protein
MEKTGTTLLPEMVVNRNLQVTKDDIPVFRGTTDVFVDMSAYSSRVKENGTVVIEPALEELSVKLAKEPNLSNFLEYYEECIRVVKDKTQLNDLKLSKANILKSVKEGRSVRQELQFQTIFRNGALFDTHNTPYLSGSLDATQALGYGNAYGSGYLNILALKTDNFEHKGSNSREVMIHSGTTFKEVKAVIPIYKFDNEDPLVRQQLVDEISIICTSLGFDKDVVNEQIKSLEGDLIKRKNKDKIDALKDKNLAKITEVNDFLHKYTNWEGVSRYSVSVMDCIEARKQDPSKELIDIAYQLMFDKVMDKYAKEYNDYNKHRKPKTKEQLIELREIDKSNINEKDIDSILNYTNAIVNR